MRANSGWRCGGWLVLAVLAVGLAAPVTAQQTGVRARGQQSRQQLEFRVRQLFAERMRSDLGLSEEQFSRVQANLEPFQQERRDLARREGATRLRIQALLQDGGRDEGEADALLQEMIELREAELALFKREMDALAGDMTSEQRLRFIVARDQLNQRIQGNRFRQGAGPPGPPPGGIDPPTGLR